jgi:hypothetical protein
MKGELKRLVGDAIADGGLPYSHLSYASDGDVVVWFDDSTPDDEVEAIVERVERSGVATYQGEVDYPHDSVSGLAFSRRDSLPLDVESAAGSVISQCETDQTVIPVTAVDEAEMPKRLDSAVHQSVWDSCREAIVSEIQSRGYRVD